MTPGPARGSGRALGAIQPCSIVQTYQVAGVAFASFPVERPVARVLEAVR